MTAQGGLIEGLSVCVDCTLVIANGEHADDISAERVAEIEAGLTQGGGIWVMACPEDCDGGFSWQACDCCGSNLGGDRHPAAILGVTV